ncbi:hypothetical protein AB1L88_15750 [Tautonia sp. JC769]|uniref:hypothetical protein n=1 Tax=Tautonia sp. JC769 TaxID=3232135 RepID=UPI0034577FCC
MAFDESGITVWLEALPDSVELLARWDDARPPGTWYQVYLNGRLLEETRSRSLVLPWPEGRCVVRVGAVPEAEAGTFQAPAAPAGLGTGTRPTLSWAGGPHQRVAGRPVVRWDVFGASEADGPIDYSTPIGLVAAVSGSGKTGGWGSGGWGSGGWGRAARRYRFRDRDRPSGRWHYGIVPVNDRGVRGPAAEVSVVVAAAPRGPTVVPGDPWHRRVRIEQAAGGPRIAWGHSPDWAGAPTASNEIQRIAAVGTTPPSPAGSMTVLYGAFSAGLAQGATAASIRTSLESSIPPLDGNIAVTGGPLGTADVDVEFIGALAETDITDGLAIDFHTFVTATVTTIQEGG